MKTQFNDTTRTGRRLLAALALLPAAALAQVPVDDSGEVFSSYEVRQDATAATGNEEIPLLSVVDLEELVGPIALYPDDLLAIVLPASAYPLQIIEAARFLEDLKSEPTLKPNPDWDDSVVALLNYPEVVELLNDDIDWTWRLGEAVVAQQADVVATIEAFRDRAYAAGNLKSDEYQNVTYDEGVIEITPVAEDVIYVPYYEPDRVVVYQPRPVYYYYPRAYPVYYYPYSSAYRFKRDRFWGITTAFQIGWYSDSLHVLHHSYYGHPYFGRQYVDRWWYRRPTLSRHNVVYVGGNTDITINRYYGGDRWRPRHDRREYVNERRFTRNRTERRSQQRHPDGNIPRDNSRDTSRRIESKRHTENLDARRSRQQRDPITFRQRPKIQTTQRRDIVGERRTGSTTRRDQRREQDPVTRPGSRRQQPVAVAPRETKSASTRRSEHKFSARSEARTDRTARDSDRLRRAEPSRRIARASLTPRPERRTESTPKVQLRRQQAPTRRVEKRESAAPPRAAPAQRQTSKRQTQRKSGNAPARRAKRYSARID